MSTPVLPRFAAPPSCSPALPPGSIQRADGRLALEGGTFDAVLVAAQAERHAPPEITRRPLAEA